MRSEGFGAVMVKGVVITTVRDESERRTSALVGVEVVVRAAMVVVTVVLPSYT